MKQLLITGAAGALGQRLTGNLCLRNPEIQIAALDLARESMEKIFAGRDNVQIYDLQDFTAGRINFASVDCIVHCAFARTQTGTALAASVDFSQRIFEAAAGARVGRVINISSQSIYGNYREIPSAEDGPVNPSDLYGMAKYACEKNGEVIFAGTDTEFVNVRMASLTGLPYPERIINKMSRFALENHRIKIVGGSQIFSFLHIDDAADALAVLTMLPGELHNTYNIGTAECYTIREVAEVIAGIVCAETDSKVVIETEEADIKHAIPLDISRFEAVSGWRAEKCLRDIVTEIIACMVHPEKDCV